ncbi:MAG TPA: hypothetical protein VEH52_02790 [Gaiellaceae bacterium]|nr:hypothetical protein [Gaiellaceae bacterium]
MSDRYEVVQLDALDRIPVGERGLEWRPIRRRLGVRPFGVNAYSTASPGGEVVEEHTETQLGHEEIYVVVRGHATFALDGEKVDAPAGTLVFVRDPAVLRTAIAVDDETLVLAVGGKPGEAFAPSAWESAFVASALMKEGRADEALAVMREENEAWPDQPAILYNLACIEALAGERDRALVDLGRAVELRPKLAELAERDTEFDAIRDDARFAEIVGESPS